MDPSVLKQIKWADGPWTITNIPGTDCIVVQDANGRTVADIDTSHPDAVGNARLFKLAPDLIDFILTVLEEMQAIRLEDKEGGSA